MIEDTSKREAIVHLGGSMVEGSEGYITGMEQAGCAQLREQANAAVEWVQIPTDMHYWNYVVDAGGYRRVAIFYKAAFYDRHAHMGIDRLPQTGAQADAWEKIEPGHEGWRSGKCRRDGANYVYVFNGRYGKDGTPPEGKHEYSDDGRRLEVVVAPDGTVLERREFTAEPGEED